MDGGPGVPDQGGDIVRTVVAVAASAGGLHALTEVLAALPPEFPAAIAVVQHLHPDSPSMLAGILSRRLRLKVVQAEDGAGLRNGVVYIAPPDHHLLVNPDATLSLTRTKPVHYVRPSADLLLQSVATSYTTHAIAVVLTGSGMDGQMGVQEIRRTGGFVIAQDEETSEFFGMPGTAIATGCVDSVLPLGEIAPALVRLVASGERT